MVPSGSSRITFCGLQDNLEFFRSTWERNHTIKRLARYQKILGIVRDMSDEDYNKRIILGKESVLTLPEKNTPEKILHKTQKKCDRIFVFLGREQRDTPDEGTEKRAVKASMKKTVVNNIFLSQPRY